MFVEVQGGARYLILDHPLSLEQDPIESPSPNIFLLYTGQVIQHGIGQIFRIERMDMTRHQGELGNRVNLMLRIIDTIEDPPINYLNP